LLRKSPPNDTISRMRSTCNFYMSKYMVRDQQYSHPYSRPAWKYSHRSLGSPPSQDFCSTERPRLWVIGLRKILEFSELLRFISRSGERSLSMEHRGGNPMRVQGMSPSLARGYSRPTSSRAPTDLSLGADRQLPWPLRDLPQGGRGLRGGR
jgi:hypothetical protein